MTITEGVNKVANSQIALLRDHMGQKCIARNIEWHPQEQISTALVKLTGEFALGYIKLKQGMAGSERHAPLLEAVLPHCPSVERVVVMTDEFTMPATKLPGAECYEALLGSASEDVVWGGFDEQTACGLCYTSGTTGNPKGVLYSHRSNFIHTLLGMQSTVLGPSPKEVILPVVPMFHANAWGLAMSCPATGANMVMPGAQMDGASIYELLDSEKVSITAAVPTVWLMLLQHYTGHATVAFGATVLMIEYGANSIERVLLILLQIGLIVLG